MVVERRTGCTSIDFDCLREASTVLTETGDTRLGQAIAPLTSGKPERQSGFHPFADGIEALSLRPLLAERAERSIGPVV